MEIVVAELPELAPGLSSTIDRQVDDNSTARQLGSGSVDVLATPELVRLMEAAAVAAVADHLPVGFTTVGVAINIKHVAPTPVGLGVKVRADLVQVEGRRLKFEVLAHDEVEEIGRGIHDRVLVEADSFVAKANRKLT
ncbi:MAG: thioesterase family protein [Anaerolineales bacterium]|nr:MAG: thioesterase family protein [Anaerolineales bacterium]